jgi:nucleotide-binding universal stress UspA family protein
MEFKKILVPIAGSDADADAIKLACRLAKKDKGKIWAVYVVTVKRALPLDAEIDSDIRKAENVLDGAERVAKAEQYEITTDVLQAREVGPAIIDESVEKGTDLILIGVKYKKHFGQFSTGDVLPYVLKNAPCPVILYQQ